MIIEQTVEIPASHRLTAESTDSVETNKNGWRSLVEWILRPIQRYRRASWEKLIADIHAHNEKHGLLFGGMDGLEYQRTIRSDWESRI